MVALQNPKQFSGRLSFISLFISARRDGYTQREGRDREKEMQERDRHIIMLLGIQLVFLARSHSSHLFFFFFVAYIVESSAIF